MWLIDTVDFMLKPVLRSEGLSYAILSHTWMNEGEVDFNDIKNPGQAQKKAGWAKIAKTCQLARSHGFKYAWIDTCCIDKSSSAELSEAINSMFRYYQKAAVCYAFLADVPSDVDVDLESSAYTSSRWFTRGWTLQELIAPSKVEFYSKDWEFLGTKSSLRSRLSKITKIDSMTLQFGDMQSVSIAQKMSWAANRETTRTEDTAYCLLGIFDINMPLLYGEGDKAFLRLQQEIMKVSEDQSIFAWSRSPGLSPYGDFSLPRDESLYPNIWHQRDIHAENLEEVYPGEHNASLLVSFLATSPTDFAFSNQVESLKYWPGYESSVPVVRGESLRIELPIFNDGNATYRWQEYLSARIMHLTFALIGCRSSNQRACHLAIPLLQWDARFYGRYGDPVLIPIDGAKHDESWIRRQMKHIEIKAEPRRGGFRPMENGDILVSFEGSFENKNRYRDPTNHLLGVYVFGQTSYDPAHQLLRSNEESDKSILLAAFHFTAPYGRSGSFAVLVGRVKISTTLKISGCLMRSLFEVPPHLEHNVGAPVIQSIIESEFLKLFGELPLYPKSPSPPQKEHDSPLTLKLRDLSEETRFYYRSSGTEHFGAQVVRDSDASVENENHFDVLRLFGSDNDSIRSSPDLLASLSETFPRSADDYASLNDPPTYSEFEDIPHVEITPDTSRRIFICREDGEILPRTSGSSFKIPLP